MSEPVVTVQGTPNPNAAKFVVTGAPVDERSRSYFDPAEAEDDPLARRLFDVPGVRALLIVENFVTVTKADEIPWDDMVEEIRCAIEEELGE